MQLIIPQDYIILKECNLENLPNLIVLTGENGAGKTVLLNALSEMMHFAVLLDDSGNRLANIAIAKPGLYVDGFEEFTITPGVIKRDYYRDLMDRWNELAALVPFSDSFNIDPNSSEEVDALNVKLNSLAHLVASRNPGAQMPSFPNGRITSNDFREILNLRKKSGKKDLEFLDYLAFVDFSGSLLSSSLSLVFQQFAIKKERYPHLVAGVQAPWDLIDEMMSAAGFNYSLEKFDLDTIQQPLNIFLKRNGTGERMHISALSSGEKTIISLIVILYNTDLLSSFPDVLLMDEPDAFLHPSMTDMFLRVIKDVLVKKGIRVIMTTHSPSTVALSPAESIFVLERGTGFPVKADANLAIRHLTKGLRTLNVSLDNRKQIYTEAKNDQLFYQQLFERMQTKNLLSQDQFLTFIQVSRNKNTEGGGFEKVVDLTDSLYANGNGNSSIYGLIDWDCVDRTLSDRILVFAQKTRYNIESFIYDPLFIACFCLKRNLPKKESFGLDDKDNQMDYLEFDNGKLQKIIDVISSEVFNYVEWKDGDNKSTEPNKIELINGKNVEMPEWYLKLNGHQLEKACRKAFDSLKSHSTEKMISDILISHFQLLPVQVKQTFEILQDRRIRITE